MNIFTAIGKILNSFTGAFVAVARTTEKTVELVENEMDNLNLEQQIRLDKVKAERIELQQSRLKLIEAEA